MLSIFFPALMAIVGFYCLNQFKKATFENACTKIKLKYRNVISKRRIIR